MTNWQCWQPSSLRLIYLLLTTSQKSFSRRRGTGRGSGSLPLRRRSGGKDDILNWGETEKHTDFKQLPKPKLKSTPQFCQSVSPVQRLCAFPPLSFRGKSESEDSLFTASNYVAVSSTGKTIISTKCFHELSRKKLLSAQWHVGPHESSSGGIFRELKFIHQVSRIWIFLWGSGWSPPVAGVTRRRFVSPQFEFRIVSLHLNELSFKLKCVCL